MTVAAAVGGWSIDHPVLNSAPAVIAFEVSDTGIGIPLEKQKLIFEAFQQADAGTSANTAAPPGSRHQPRTSQPARRRNPSEERAGQSSTFTLYLPLKYSGPTVAPRAQPRRHTPQRRRCRRRSRARQRTAAGRPAQSGARRHHPLDRRGRSALRAGPDRSRPRQGLKVLVATRGAEALDLAKQYQPAAVSLDVFLPDMLGWTVLSQLKHNPLTRHIPVQIITLDEDRQHALARGAFSFVNKPTTTEGVSAALRRSRNTPSRAASAVGSSRTTRRSSLSIRELLDHNDIEIVATDTGAARSRCCATTPAIAWCWTCGYPT